MRRKPHIVTTKYFSLKGDLCTKKNVAVNIGGRTPEYVPKGLKSTITS